MSNHANWDFHIDIDVRDYECDAQGIVNNAVYMNYLEHCRHQFLKTIGLDFIQLADNGLDLVVTDASLSYRSPLRAGDQCRIFLTRKMAGRIRFEFHQQIVRKPDDTLILTAKIQGTGVANGKPSLPDFVRIPLIGETQ